MEAPEKKVIALDDAQGPAASEPGPEDVRQALQKILSSRTFHAAEGRRNFLRYTVEQKLAGRGAQIKEYSVGVEVFGRAESFDPRESSIVRSEARKLRARLAKYYQGEGERDPVRIGFPKGSYSPTFQVWIPLPPPTQSSSVPPIRELDPVASRVPRLFPFPRTWKQIAVLAGLVLLTGGAVYMFAGRSRMGPSADVASIAVLPFSNLSQDQDDSFSDGLAEELIYSLTRVPGLHVVGRTSAFQFKGRTVDVRRVGRELNVRSVLAGSVRKYGDRLRITAQLNDATNGYSLWSESYDREVKDALAIQLEISKAITNSLGLRLAGRSVLERSADPQGPGVNPEAYLEYLKGLYFRSRATGDNIQTAIGHFQRAIAIDPAYAAAYAGLATCYMSVPVFGTTPPREMVPKIRQAATKALQLDSALNEAHRAIAWALVYDYDWKGAEEEFKKAIELNPGDVASHFEYAHCLQRQGRLDEALLEDQQAVSLDPVSPRAIRGLARSLYFLKRYDEAIEQYQRALALDPGLGIGHQALGLAYLLKKAYPNALAETETARRLMGGDSVTTAQLGYTYAVSGNLEGAQKILHEFLEQSKRGPFPALAVAHLYIGLDDKDRALEWLGKAIDQHDVNVSLKSDPLYDSLRSDPRFDQLLRFSKLN